VMLGEDTMMCFSDPTHQTVVVIHTTGDVDRVLA
jgi:hypothetical protein